MYMDNGNTLVPQHLTQVSNLHFGRRLHGHETHFVLLKYKNGSKKKMIFENFAFLMLLYHKGL